MKCLAAVRVLAYGSSADSIDDYVHIGEDTILEAVRRFTLAVMEIFGDEYLRAHNMITPRGSWVRAKKEDGRGCLDQ
jgi:hypothetical protein